MSTQALEAPLSRTVRRCENHHMREVGAKMQWEVPLHTRGLLDSWKEIAVYLGREVRTVQRWERREGLPVHRHIHVKGCTVYAFKEEIDVWLKRRGLTLSEPPQSGTLYDGRYCRPSADDHAIALVRTVTKETPCKHVRKPGGAARDAGY